MKSFQITAPHFTAGGEYGQDGRENLIVKKAAPILNYMIGWTEGSVQSYSMKKGWKYNSWACDTSSVPPQSDGRLQP